MTVRIFSHKHQLYTNSPFWPSNQRTTSDFLLATSGEIIELVCAEDSEFSIIHPPHDFSVEPWTGLFDSKGKKIYLGDIIVNNKFNTKYKIIWRFDRFLVKEMELKVIYPMFNRNDFEENLSVTNTIHGVNF